MGDSTTIVSQTNVRLREALAACAHLRGKNAFLDLALDAGDRFHLPPETRLVGYAAQEKAFLVFLKTLEPHLPRTPTVGPRSQGTLLLRSESDATWLVLLSYGPRPSVAVRRLAWLSVPLGRVRPLRGSKGPPKSAAGTRFVDPSGEFVIARVASTTLHVVRGSAGSKGRATKKKYAHGWQAEAALERLAATLRKQGFRRARANAHA